MSGSDYYWVAAHDYFMGSTVSPGHWGRVLSSYLVGAPAADVAAPSARWVERLPLALREYVFESVRLRLNPELPSRLECLFLFASLEQAQRLIVSQRPARNHEFVYRVELVEDRPVTPASLELTAVEHGDTVAVVAQKARLYWTGYETATMEWLTLSPIRVLDKVPLRLPTSPAGRRPGPTSAPCPESYPESCPESAPVSSKASAPPSVSGSVIRGR